MQPDDFELKNFALADEDHKLKVRCHITLSAIIIFFADSLSSRGSKTGWWSAQIICVTVVGACMDEDKWAAEIWRLNRQSSVDEHMKGGGTLKGTIDGDYYKTYSKYLVR